MHKNYKDAMLNDSGEKNIKCSREVKPVDNINPSHYRQGKIEVIDFIMDKGLNFSLGNVIKYIARAGKKDGANPIEDLQKAKQYIDFEIERLEKAGITDQMQSDEYTPKRARAGDGNKYDRMVQIAVPYAYHVNEEPILFIINAQVSEADAAKIKLGNLFETFVHPFVVECDGVCYNK